MKSLQANWRKILIITSLLIPCTAFAQDNDALQAYQSQMQQASQTAATANTKEITKIINKEEPSYTPPQGMMAGTATAGPSPQGQVNTYGPTIAPQQPIIQNPPAMVPQPEVRAPNPWQEAAKKNPWQPQYTAPAQYSQTPVTQGGGTPYGAYDNNGVNIGVGGNAALGTSTYGVGGLNSSSGYGGLNGYTSQGLPAPPQAQVQSNIYMPPSPVGPSSNSPPQGNPSMNPYLSGQ